MEYDAQDPDIEYMFKLRALLQQTDIPFKE